MRAHGLEAEWRRMRKPASDSANTPALNSAIVLHTMGNHGPACFPPSAGARPPGAVPRAPAGLLKVWPSLLVYSGATLWLAGCAHAPPIPRAEPKVAAAREFANPAVRAALAAFPPETSAPPGTLTSSEALAAALNFNPDIALQRAQLDLARAEVLRARQRPNPILSLSPERVINAASGVSPWVVALSLVWPTRTAGKRKLEIEQALAMSDAALLTGANTVWQLRASVRGAVCALELANARNELIKSEAAMRGDLAARLVKQADAGIASRYDAMRAQLENTQASQRLRQSEAELHAARHDLADATGLPAAEIEQRTIGHSCLPAGALAIPAAGELQEAAIAARLDLRARLAEFRAVDAALRTELARRVPDLNLGPGYTYDQGDRKITFTLSGELPVFSHNDAAIAKARADRDRVIAEVDKLQWSVRSGLERALDQFALARQQYDDAQGAVRQAEELRARDRERLNAGELDRPAIITGQIAALATRLDALTVQRTLIDALALLEAAAQTPFAPPFFDASAASRVLAPAPPASPQGSP